MSTNDTEQFVFMTCHPGAEAALKAEVARTAPELHPAFSQPGFLTFKYTGRRPLDEKHLASRSWVLAHSHGLSLGRLTGTQLGRLAADVWQLGGMASWLEQGPPADVHVWQAGRVASNGDELLPWETPLAAEIEAAVRAAAPDSCVLLHSMPTEDRRATQRNGRVLDVVAIEPGQWWIGHHRASSVPQRWPGGIMPIALPEHAVSRAYAKMEEALQWSGLPLAAGDECVEIGCAPGGSCQALLERGLFVTGVDPAEVDESLLTHPRFRHLQQRGKEVRRTEFEGVRWLAVDMNVQPTYTLDTLEAIVTHPGLSIRGMIVTLKLGEWEEADALPALAERVYGWGFRDVRMRQLSTGGREVCLAALRRKALRRLAGANRRRHRSQRPKPRAAQETRTDAPHDTLSGPHS